MDMHFEGVIFQTHAQELRRRISRPHPPFRILDVRPAERFAEAHIPGSRSVQPAELEGGLPDGDPPSTEFIIVGEGPGDPAVRAASLALGRLGAHRRVELTNGILEWSQLGYPLENGRRQEA